MSFSFAALAPSTGYAESATGTDQHTSDTKKSNKKPKITTKTVTETHSIGFKTKKQDDSSLAAGQTKVLKAGKKGSEKRTYKITYTNGKQTKKVLLKHKTIKAVVTKVIAIGTYVAPAPAPQEESTPAPAADCDPNYSGACVPIASDVDCAGGSGNGPAYVQGPVHVIGTDIYGLDGNGDGIGCQ